MDHQSSFNGLQFAQGVAKGQQNKNQLLLWAVEVEPWYMLRKGLLTHISLFDE